jgi:cyclic pyranopterin monophosphate synthase
MAQFTHLDASGRPSMVDVSEKPATRRVARARAVVFLPESLRVLARDGELQSAKGPVFHTAVIAGTTAVKKTSDLIPLCHPLPIEKCSFDIRLSDSADRVIIECEVATHHRTGVEMEALTGASVAALCIYDMCKAVSQDIRIGDIELLNKEGGKRDFKR